MEYLSLERIQEGESLVLSFPPLIFRSGTLYDARAGEDAHLIPGQKRRPDCDRKLGLVAGIPPDRSRVPSA
jgi:hypothetical protein